VTGFKRQSPANLQILSPKKCRVKMKTISLQTALNYSLVLFIGILFGSFVTEHTAFRNVETTSYSMLKNAHVTTEKSARALALVDAHSLPGTAPRECVTFLTGFSTSFTSQFSQDAILYYNFWAGRLANGDKGFYVDLGANDPKLISNTWFLDKCLGWKGLCIEADPILAENLQKSERTCKVVNMCASGERSTLPYVTKGSGGHVAVDKEKADVFVKCSPLSEILVEEGVQHVDFL
jgi:hypothetical protein